MAKQAPQIGQWYQDATLNRLFEVVAVDDASGSIEIQYEDGDVDELDPESWSQMIVIAASQPEDWRSSFELSTEDRYSSDDVYIPDLGGDPFSSIEPESFTGWDDF